MPDHIHLLAGIPPKYSVSQFMGYLKGKGSLMISGRHANLKYKFGNRHFWADGYYVSAAGLNGATIRKHMTWRRTRLPGKNTGTFSRVAGNTDAPSRGCG